MADYTLIVQPWHSFFVVLHWACIHDHKNVITGTNQVMEIIDGIMEQLFTWVSPGRHLTNEEKSRSVFQISYNCIINIV